MPRFTVASETGPLRAVLVCPPEHFRWIPTNAVARRTLASGARPDARDIAAQHGELRAALAEAGVTVHLIRQGLAVIGMSGGRTDEAGAAQLATWLRDAGWECRIEPFDEHFLHLDLIFCMAAPGLALACTAALDPAFVAWLAARGIRVIPVGYADAMRLGCNILALGGGRVVSARGSLGVNTALRAEGLTVLDPDLSLFTAGGGGPHCLTCPLLREDP